LSQLLDCNDHGADVLVQFGNGLLLEESAVSEDNFERVGF
jgi:hypothetical protein